MVSKDEVQERMIKRTMQAYPAYAPVVSGSTPVVSFGDSTEARVATLGINPSFEEFQDGDKNILNGDLKRLVDHEILGGDFRKGLDENQAKLVINGCASYFHKRPYDWFADLESVVLKPNGFEYKSGEACHLDLIQWATDPVWSKIENKTDCESLLQEDAEFLQFQLTSQNYDFVFLNGDTVIKQVKSLGLFKIRLAGLTPIGHGPRKSRLWLSQFGVTKFIGWNLNIQRHETTQSNKEALSEWIKQQIQNKK